MIKKILIVILSTLIVSCMLPITVLADDAGDPGILDPQVSMTISYDATEVMPGDIVNMQVAITNNSHKAIYVSGIYFECYANPMDDSDWFRFDINPIIVSPNSTSMFDYKYTVDSYLFSYYKGKLECHLSPSLYYYYYSPEIEDYSRRYYREFEYYCKEPVILSVSPEFSYPIKITIVAEKRENQDIYDFYVTIYNGTDSTLENVFLCSNELYFSNYSSIGSIAQGGTYKTTLTYDRSADKYKEIGKKSVALHLEAGEWDNLYSYRPDYYAVSSNVCIIDFPQAELQLEAQLIYNINEAHFRDEIPYTLALYNPTDKTYENIEMYPDIIIEEIKPNETIYVNKISQASFPEYYINIYDTQYVYLGLPYIGLEYNDAYYFFHEWCINYYEIEMPEIKITMPPPINDIVSEIKTPNNSTARVNVYYDNTLGEKIELAYLGYPENGDYTDFSEIVIGEGASFFQLDTSESAYTHDTDNNLFLEFVAIGYGEETGKLYWIHDTFPVTQIVYTPTPVPTDTPIPTPTRTPAPTPTPERILSAVISSNEGISKDGSTQNIKIQLINETQTMLFSIRVFDDEENILYELGRLSAGEEVTQIIDVPFKKDLSLDIKFLNNKGIQSQITTNTITTIGTNQFNNNKLSLVLIILIIVGFISVSAVSILLIRKRLKVNNDTQE